MLEKHQLHLQAHDLRILHCFAIIDSIEKAVNNLQIVGKHFGFMDPEPNDGILKLLHPDEQPGTDASATLQEFCYCSSITLQSSMQRNMRGERECVYGVEVKEGDSQHLFYGMGRNDAEARQTALRIALIVL